MSEYRGSTTNDLDKINLKTLRKKTIMSVVTEPTPSESTLGDKIERDGKLYECVFNGTDYSWREIAFGIISVASLPLDNISDTAFYRVLNTNSGEYEIYCYNPDENKWCKINNKSIEYTDDLSTISNPKKDYFYAQEIYKFIRNDLEIDNSAFKGYTSSNGYAITISSDKCIITNTSTQSVVFEELWTNITDENIATLINDGCLIEDSNILNLGEHYTAYEFFRVAENTYCSKDEVSKTTKYTFYYNPTETPTLDSFIKLSTNEGSGGSVSIDGVTIEENTSGELQSNSIINVSTLPTSDIKTKSLYQLAETITYEEEGVSKTFAMNKLFKHTDGAWSSVSRVYLNALQYDALTDEQKTDGTLYIVSDATNPAITWNYSVLNNKPVINGVTLDGRLTLENLQLYSKTEVNNLLAQKGNALFVDELPTEMQPLYWYYSKKYQDGNPVANEKRALYIKDNNGVVQYMGITGDVDLSNYYTIEQANTTFVSKAEFNGDNLFDGAGFSVLNKSGQNILDGLSGTVYRIFNNVYVVYVMMIIFTPLSTGLSSYTATFTLKDGTNLLDINYSKNSPIPIYSRSGATLGNCMLDKNKIRLNLTASEGEVYRISGLLIRTV